MSDIYTSEWYGWRHFDCHHTRLRTTSLQSYIFKQFSNRHAYGTVVHGCAAACGDVPFSPPPSLSLNLTQSLSAKEKLNRQISIVQQLSLCVPSRMECQCGSSIEHYMRWCSENTSNTLLPNHPREAENIRFGEENKVESRAYSRYRYRYTYIYRCYTDKNYKRIFVSVCPFSFLFSFCHWKCENDERGKTKDEKRKENNEIKAKCEFIFVCVVGYIRLERRLRWRRRWRRRWRWQLLLFGAKCAQDAPCKHEMCFPRYMCRT